MPHPIARRRAEARWRIWHPFFSAPNASAHRSHLKKHHRSHLEVPSCELAKKRTVVSGCKRLQKVVNSCHGLQRVANDCSVYYIVHTIKYMIQRLWDVYGMFVGCWWEVAIWAKLENTSYLINSTKGILQVLEFLFIILWIWLDTSNFHAIFFAFSVTLYIRIPTTF